MSIFVASVTDLEQFEEPSDHHLPDGSPLPHTATIYQNVVSDWTGRRCSRCKGTGAPQVDEVRFSCVSCAGTGGEYAGVWLWEE